MICSTRLIFLALLILLALFVSASPTCVGLSGELRKSGDVTNYTTRRKTTVANGVTITVKNLGNCSGIKLLKLRLNVNGKTRDWITFTDTEIGTPKTLGSLPKGTEFTLDSQVNPSSCWGTPQFTANICY
ncbi:hypothetical protein F8M41_022964 [Gigaspora margarita]|uniref:Uncharacterized protein n=1 Tax=Gigaspora margarita TaxID=4874 RepID=A0A8H4AE84_GIGMA|nr:hypothetical protein F8M41_022964 [Gigaspora margarita]